MAFDSFINSSFNSENYLQTDGTAQGPHMSCSYADISNIFIRKLQNIISLPQRRKGLEMIFLYFGRMVEFL